MTNPASATSVAESPGYVLPDDPTLPAGLRGRSLADLASYIATLENAVQGGQPVTPPEPPPAPTPPVIGNNGQYATREQLQAIATQQATVALDLARQKFPDVFARWSNEVAALLQNVPPENLTLDTFSRAAQMVRGNHVDEIVAEKMRQASQPMMGALRSTGHVGPLSVPPRSAPVPEPATIGRWQERAARAGITDAEVEEFARANDMSPDEFWRQFGSGIVSDAVADLGSGKRNGAG